MALNIYYDGECPFCTRYVGMLRLSQVTEVNLVNLRAESAIRSKLESQGFDVDRGMVVEYDGRLIGGADAVNTLALLSTSSGIFNQLTGRILSRPAAARIVYPLLRLGRWIALFLLGRDLIGRGEARTNARQTIFASLFALFSVFHFMNYAFKYGRFPPEWDLLALLLAATLLFFRPGSSRALFLLMFASTVSTIAQAPVGSNHTMVRTAVLIGYWLSFAAAALRNKPSNRIFAGFAPAGQGALLVMYVFGIFHKINTDFLNPVTSCAMALWREMPLPLAALDGPVIWYSTIYGTFLVEGAVMLALLYRRWRHIGIVLGIGFHLLLSLSSYAMYVSFTMLAISLHTLFLSDAAAQSILDSRGMRFIRSRMRDPVYLTAAFVLLAGLAVLAVLGNYTLATLFALPIVLPFCAIILLHGRSSDTLGWRDNTGRFVGALVTALFFVNAIMPYFGLKSAQSMNMFANLRLESGVSNHLILSSPPGPFKYLEQVAIIEDSGGDPRFSWYENSGLGIVYYELLSMLSEGPDVKITYSMDGHIYRNVSRDDLQAEMAATLHPAWFRKWFHFQAVALERPEKCNV